MNGLDTIKAYDNQEIVLLYQRALKNGDTKLAANIQYAHPDLAARLQPNG